MNRRVTPIAVVVFLGLAALSVAGWIGLHWTELVLVPRAWSELRRLQDLVDADDDPYVDEEGEQELREARNAAAMALIRLQVPDFAGGPWGCLEKIPTDDGSDVFLLCYERGEEKRLPHPAAGSLLPASYRYHHRFVRGNGTLFVPESPHFLGEDRGGHTVEDGSQGKRGVYWRFYRGNPLGIHHRYPRMLYTWDRRGFVRHGFVDETPLARPVHDTWVDDPIRFDRAQANTLLASSFPGDVIRALDLWGKAPDPPVEVARPLVHHHDPDVRALALALLPGVPESSPLFAEALSDAAPRVRLTALEAFCETSCRRWRQRLLKLAEDTDPVVSEAALLRLRESFDRGTACDAVVRLLERGRVPDLPDDIELLRSCASPRVFRALRRMLDTVPRESVGWLETLVTLVVLDDQEQAPVRDFLENLTPAEHDILILGAYEYVKPFDVFAALSARGKPHDLLASKLRSVLTDVGDSPWPRLHAAAVLHAWGEPGLDPLLVDIIEESEGVWHEWFCWPLARHVLADRDVSEGLLRRILKPGKEEDLLLSDPFFVATDPLLPEVTVPALQRLIEDGSVGDWELTCRATLARWGIPGAAEALREALKDPELRKEGIVGMEDHPELLSVEEIRELFLESLDQAIPGAEDDQPDIRDLLDALAERHATTPLPGAIPVLERIVESRLPGASRALLRLVVWDVPGSRKRMAEWLPESCEPWRWSRAERAELPEELRALAAEME